jgi:uncharacterized Zn-binding protein involved in type VI secretion
MLCLKSKKTEATNVNRVLKAKHWFATIGSRTERGGRVTSASGSLAIVGLAIAVVDDVVTYEDGSKAVIMDGAGYAATHCDKPYALVGSRLSNGDRIVESLQNKFAVDEYHDRPIPGLFDPAYTVPKTAATDGASIDA